MINYKKLSKKQLIQIIEEQKTIINQLIFEKNLAGDLNNALTELSTTDDLTKLKNHRCVIENLKFAIKEVNEKKEYLSIILLDIDDFKKVNDRKGHQFGDEVLIKIADILKKCVRETDLAGRYGGEEFLIVLRNTQLSEAAIVAERIRYVIESAEFGCDTHITISGGVKQYGGEEIQDFISEADKRLYQAKNEGKNLVIY